VPLSLIGGGGWGWGLEEPMIRPSYRSESEINTCHFEPKARNLEFHFPPVLRGEAAGFTVRESVGTTSLPCSPPIPSFPPIREKGGGCVKFLKGSLSKETASKLIGLPSPQWGEGAGEAHGDTAARERDDYGNCAGRKGAVREDAHREVPLSLRGGGAVAPERQKNFPSFSHEGGEELSNFTPTYGTVTRKLPPKLPPP